MPQDQSRDTDETPLKWTDRDAFTLDGLHVTLSEPVLVKRSQWYCWFPSLVRQPDGTLWALMQAYADINVASSFYYLSRSRDGGLTWDEPRVIGSAGLSHVILADGSAVILPYHLQQRPGGVIGAPCNVISPEGELTVRSPGVTVTGWTRPLRPLAPDHPDTAGFVFNGQSLRGAKGEYLTTLYGKFEGDNRYSLVLVESEDGFAWRMRSVIAGADCALAGTEGPCESALCRLTDAASTDSRPGRLMCVFRLMSFVPYGRTWSEDDGRTWSRPVSMTAGSVEPSIQVMPRGVLALSGGRPGLAVWFGVDGVAARWQSVDIVAHHNACRPQDLINPDSTKAWTVRDDMIRQGLSGFTSSYTELTRLDDRHLLLIYDRLGLGWHPIPDGSSETNSVWVVRIGLQTTNEELA
jgi:hypothetical protein